MRGRFWFAGLLSVAVATSVLAAWDPTRDNSMSPVDLDADTAEGTIGRSMAIVLGLAGKTQATQVCSGVYLTTAHGLLDNPNTALTENRAHRTIDDNNIGIFPYPFSPESRMLVRGRQNIISPVIDDPRHWSDSFKDFAFIIVENTERPDDYVKIADVSGRQVVSFSEQLIPIIQYRGNSFYHTEGGEIDFSRRFINGTSDYIERFREPQRVNQVCNVHLMGERLLTTDCPFESGVSGSSLYTILDDIPYILGLSDRASNTILDTRGGTVLDNLVNPPRGLMCRYYERACGLPCSELNFHSNE